MGKGINQVLTATCTDEYEEVAAEQLLDRALLYNRDKKDLNIVIGQKAVPLTAVDSNNIIKNEKNQIALKDDIIVDSVTTRADHEGLDWKSQSKIGETSDNNTVFLFFKQKSNQIQVDGTNGHVSIVDMTEGSLTVTYHSGKKLTSCKVYLSEGNSTTLVASNKDMSYVNGTYSYTINHSSFVDDAVISVCVVATGDSTVNYPQGSLSDVSTWSSFTYKSSGGNDSTPAVIGGELLEVGNGVLGHYQISLTSSGSRLLKGATTYTKKAKLVLAKLNDIYYYGIKFKSGIPASIYFAGWQHTDDSLLPPAYTEYGDSDLSEVIELDDDSDTGTQVEEPDLTVLPNNVTWEFETAPYVKAINYRTYTFRSSDLGTYWRGASNRSASEQWWDGSSWGTHPFVFGGNGSTFGTGWRYVNDLGYMHLYLTIDYTYDGTKMSAKHDISATTIDGRGCTAVGSSGICGYLHITGNTLGKTIFRMRSNDSNTRRISLIEIDPVTRLSGKTVASANVTSSSWQNIEFNVPAGEYYLYQSATMYYSDISFEDVTETIRDETWNQSGNNNGFDLKEGLVLSTEDNSSWYEGTLGGNAGYITIEDATSLDEDDIAFTLSVKGGCDITVGFTSNEASNRRVYISPNRPGESNWLDGYNTRTSNVSSSTSDLQEVTFHTTGKVTEEKTVYIYCEQGGFNLMYVEATYDSTKFISNVISELDNTGEDGTAHIIRPRGIITKQALLNIAKELRDNSSLQVIVDLRNCTMEPDYVNWTDDSDLTNLFCYCTSLRAFYYPKNVTHSGVSTFMHCSFLREVHFNDEMLWLGKAEWHTDYIGVFAGSRIKSIYLPASIKGLTGFTFSESNIINVYIEKGTSLSSSIAIPDSASGWCAEWYKVKRLIQFYFHESDYERFHTTTETFGNWALGSGSGSTYTGTDADKFLHSDDLIKDHVVKWENYFDDDPESTIKYVD